VRRNLCRKKGIIGMIPLIRLLKNQIDHVAGLDFKCSYVYARTEGRPDLETYKSGYTLFTEYSEPAGRGLAMSRAKKDVAGTEDRTTGTSREAKRSIKSF
jgi:hypothetical protein